MAVVIVTHADISGSDPDSKASNCNVQSQCQDGN